MKRKKVIILVITIGVVCLFILGYLVYRKQEKANENKQGEVAINIISEEANEGESGDEKNLEKDNKTNKKKNLDKQADKQADEKDKDEILNSEGKVSSDNNSNKEVVASKDEIVSYRTYKLCQYFSYGVDVEVITGKKSEIINPSFILNKIARNGFGLPEGTRVNSFKIKEGNIGYLDLTKQINTVVGSSGFEEERNATIANTFMSAYGVNGLVITVNGGCFDGGSHKSYGINEQVGTSLVIHDPTHNLEKYKEEVKKYTGDTVLEEGNVSGVHSQEEIDKARKVLEDEYKTDFLYLDETCGAPEMFEPFNDEFILFLKNGGGDAAYAIKRGTSEIYILLQPAEMITLEEFKRRYPR